MLNREEIIGIIETILPDGWKLAVEEFDAGHWWGIGVMGFNGKRLAEKAPHDVGRDQVMEITRGLVSRISLM